MFEFHASDLSRCIANESLSTYKLDGARSQGGRICCTGPDIPEAIVFLMLGQKAISGKGSAKGLEGPSGRRAKKASKIK